MIIPAFDEEAALPETLRRLNDAIEPAIKWECVVCDNASTDRTAEIARRYGARVVEEPVRQIARARNTGARAARGEWLLFLDADSHPPPGLMRETLALTDQPTTLGCGSTFVVHGDRFNKLRLERLNPVFRIFGYCGGAYLLCRADAFRAVGGFSTELFAAEEIEFLRRLKRWGRERGLRFHILHRHPVETSGRKGELRPGALFTLVVSNVAAVALYGLHAILPQGWSPRTPQWLLRYWYPKRRSDG